MRKINSIQHHLNTFATGTSILLLTVSVLVLVAWEFEFESLKSIVHGWPTMKANTALCFLCSGIALYILQRKNPRIRLVRMIGVFVGLIGLLTIYEYVSGNDAGIDQLFFHESIEQAGNSIPGRMGIVTAVSFAIVGFVLVTISVRSLMIVQQIILVSGIYIMLFIVNGFLFKYETIVSISPLIMVAVHTAILYILLAVALLSFTASTGFMALFVSDTSGGLILRRLYTGTIIIPFIIGWLRILGNDAGLYSPEFGVVLFVFLIILILGIFVSWVALHIHRLDQERTKIQEQLYVSREHYRNLFENAPVAMCRFHLSGAGITAANDKLVELMGLSKDEILSHPHDIPWVEPSVWERVIAGVNENGLVKDLETTIITKNGTNRYCLISATLFLHESFIEVSWIDITERKRAEEQLTATLSELERSNKELEQFAYVVSHDLQAPLQSVAGYSELLLEENAVGVTSTQKEYLKNIGDALARMQSFIKNLLVYSQVGAKKKFVTVAMEDVVEELLAMFSTQIQNKGVEIIVDPLPAITADQLQMKQLLQNLIGNALKFRTSEPLTIHISGREQEQEWEFFVKDNGIGIEQKYFQQIFVVFQRLHTNYEYEGTGIGLALCKKIVDLHKGRIRVESEPGKGTTFYFTIAKLLA